jgi:hypothetical protein
MGLLRSLHSRAWMILTLHRLPDRGGLADTVVVVVVAMAIFITPPLQAQPQTPPPRSRYNLP